MKDYLPLKVEFCLYENLLCGRILQQDDRLIEQVDKRSGILIKEDNSSYHISILLTPGLCNYTLYLRGADKDEDNSIFYYEYDTKHDAEIALRHFKTLIMQTNDCYYEEEIVEKKNTYFVEICE